MFFNKKILIKKFIPVALTGAFLMWLIYFIMDKSDMKDVKIISMRIILFQAVIFGMLLYYVQYKKWHLARKLLKDGVIVNAEITNLIITSSDIFSVNKGIKLTYIFQDASGVEYSRTPHYAKLQFNKWFNSSIPNIGDKVQVIYDSSNPNHSMLSPEAAYGQTTSKF